VGQLREKVASLEERNANRPLSTEVENDAMGRLQPLASMLDRPLVVYDVGARWGVLSTWEALGDKVRVIGFEPDAAECDRLNQLAPANTMYTPTALGHRRETAVLHIAQDPACSSLYPPRSSLIERNAELDVMREVSAHEIDVLPLDEWISENGEEAPDVLKLDTQGSELDILRGAVNALRTTEIVDIEVEFNAIYEGQPLFWQVDAYLRNAGFELWRLGPLVHYSDNRTGSRGTTALEVYFDSVPSAMVNGAGQLFWAQAYYVRTDLGVCGIDQLPAARGWRVAAAVRGLGLNDLAELVLSRVPLND
jgi:FkbM family methyltransferase